MVMIYRLSRLERRMMSRKARRYLTQVEAHRDAAVANAIRLYRIKAHTTLAMEMALNDIQSLQRQLDGRGVP